MKFVDVKSDIAFKKVFGNENKKEILISFLNAVLDLKGSKEIAEIEILNPYQAPRLDILKETTLDVRAKTKEGTIFIIEMQVEKKAGFKKRVVYYSSKAYSNQIDTGENYPKLNQVIFIGILNFSIFEGDKYLTKHLILNTATMRQELTDLEFNFIELPKFNKREDELIDVIEKWIYFIKNAPDLQFIPKSADFKEIVEAYEVADQFKWSKEELEVYDYWLMKEQDARGAVEQAKIDGEMKGLIKGIEKGRVEGLKEGLEKGKSEIAKNLLKQGLDIKIIINATGLSKEEIEKL